MQFNFKEIFTAFMVLFAVIDIIGNIPIVIDLRKKSRTYTKRKSLYNCRGYPYCFSVFRKKYFKPYWY